MKPFLLPFCIAAGFVAALPAASFAQLSGTETPGNSGGSGPAGIQPRPVTPDFAPPAVPGAGGPSLATAQAVPQANAGDPTAELFGAVNKGDYNAAQDAVSRGADISAQNTLGETPLDLSIALNRNTITFMLLSARNEGGETGPVGAPWTLATSTPTPTPNVKHGKFRPTPAAMNMPPNATPGDNPGTPNANAGFLGFGPNR